VDADCSSNNLQCHTRNVTNLASYFTCSGGLDDTTIYGLCIPKPAPASGTAQQLCSACLSAVRPLVDQAVATVSVAPATLSEQFYQVCSAKGYALAECSRVQAAITMSYRGNLARRAGALCIRLNQCSALADYTVTAEPSRAVLGATRHLMAVMNTTNATASTQTTGNSRLTGVPDACRWFWWFWCPRHI
jgi:hypothetical protein